MRGLFVLCLLAACDGGDVDPTEDVDGDGFSQAQGDCDESDAAIFPGAAESCDGVDSDCDGEDGGPGITSPLWFEDTDDDGFGDESTAVAACEAPGASWVDAGGDCQVDDGLSFPGADETCDGVDNDCDDETDEDQPPVYADGDDDGFGDPDTPLAGCETGPGRVIDDQDCDDTDSAINPDTVWYFDVDQDGWGLDTLTDTGCEAPGPDYASQLGDCRPNDPNGYPGATEICDNGSQPQNIDDNCNGFVDEGCRVVFDCEPIETDTTWSGTIIVPCDVSVGALDVPTLTVEDGTTVRFQDGASLDVGPLASGMLVVQDGPLGVRFTSDAVEPATGDWDGVELNNAEGSQLNNLTIAYAGGNESASLVVRADGIQADGLSVVASASSGLDVYGTGLQVTDFHADDVSGEAIRCEVGGDLSVTNAEITGSGGVMTTHLDCADALSGDLDLLQNDNDRVLVSGLALSESATWSALGVPYILTQGMSVAGDELVTLTLQPGVEILVETDERISVGAAGRGALLANGTVSQPILFSSTGAPAMAGDWTGLVFQDEASTSELTHVSVAHAGSSDVFDASVYVQSGAVIASDVVIEDGAADGVQVWGGTLQLSDCYVEDHAGAGLAVEPFGDLAAPVTGCTIGGNGVAARFGNSDAIDRLDSSSTLTGNVVDRVVVEDMTLERDSVWQDLGIPYFLQEGLTVASSDAPASLSINGATVQVGQGRQLQVGMTSTRVGSLQATGATFEGEVDGPGAWLGIGVRGPTTLEADTVVRGAGSNGGAAVEVYTGPADLTDVAIEDSAGIGVRCWSGSLGATLTNVSFMNVSDTQVVSCDVP